MKTGEGRVLVLNVSQRDSGEYLCEAETKMGSQRSRPVPLEVNTAIGEQKSFHLWVWNKSPADVGIYSRI